MQNDDAAHAAYRQLLAGERATDDDLRDMAYFYEGHPVDAGRIAELQYRNTGAPRALRDAVYDYVQARAWPRIANLLASLTPKERALADRSPDVLSMLAEYERQTRQPDAALRDLRRAAALPDASADVQAAYLWTLVDFGDDAELRSVVMRWRARSLDVATLWGPYAAALTRLNQPAEALRYFRRRAAASKGDPLWVLALADTEEAVGHGGTAWSLRRYVWTTLLPRDPDVGPLPAAAPRRGGLAVAVSSDDLERREELRERRVALSQLFEDGDAARRVLIEMLRADGARPGADALGQSVLGDVGKLPPVRLPADTANFVAQPETSRAANLVAQPETLRAANLVAQPETLRAANLVAQPDTPRAANSAVQPETPRVADEAGVTDGMSAPQQREQRQISSAAAEVALAWARSQESDPLAKAWLTHAYANRLTRPADAELAIALANRDVATIERILDAKDASRVPIADRIDGYETAGRPGEAEALAFAGSRARPRTTTCTNA
ncbi:MAG: tetratricopeptide repeat protein [Pararobbsia sp.]